MKSIRTITGLVFAGLATAAFAQTDVAPAWKISSVGGVGINYSWFGADANTNGLAYNPVTNHLIVVSRTGGTNIVVLDAATGAFVKNLDTTGISGGTLTAVRVDVTDDGVIYVSNLAAAAATFKVYRYANENATPTVAYEETNVPVRMGDDMDVTGTGNNTKILVSNGSAGGQLPVLITTDGGLTFTKQIRTGNPAIQTGTSPIVAWHSNGTDYYVKLANSNTLQHYTWNTMGTIDSGTNLSDNTFFTIPEVNQMAGIALRADSSNPGDQWIVYALGQQHVGNNTPAPVRKTSALTTAIYHLTSTGGNADGTVNFADTARRGKPVIADANTIFLLNVGNSIARYNMPSSVPVTMSSFSLD